MFKYATPVLAAAILAAACATPAPVAGPVAAPSSGGGTPAPAAGTATVMNIATASAWVSDERLLPDDPILALVGASGNLNQQAGFSMTCNPDDGKMTGRLGKQPATRNGQSGMYRLRIGSNATQLEGKFETKGQDTAFVFPVSNAVLRNFSQADVATFVSDTGEPMWAFVKDPAAPAQAKYIASLKDIGTEAEAFRVYCNPK